MKNEKHTDILADLKNGRLVIDGAMGTMLYQRGIFLNRCYDEINLTQPEIVRGIHQDYVKAGADVIETNSFGANRIKLKAYGLADRVTEINRKAAELAREAAGDKVYVAGSVGPCLRAGQLFTTELREELTAVYSEQISALAEGGADMIFLETFSHSGELLLAAACAKTAGIPVMASFTLTTDGRTPADEPLRDIVCLLHNDANVDALGLNCGTGPSHAFDALRQILELTDKPVVVMPNAGFPRQVEDRLVYLANPEYFAEYAKKFIELGARGVGGCCGTTPDHIRHIARAVKSLSQVKQHVQVHIVSKEAESDVKPVPVENKSRLACLLCQGRKVTSVELLPPRSTDLTAFLEKARTCAYHGVDAINIPDGPRASARVSPMIAAAAVQREAGIEAVLHYTCRDRNLIGMQSDILGGVAAGIRNFLIITGDPPKSGDYPDITGVFDVDAIGLTHMVYGLNHGRDFGGAAIHPPTPVFTGVGANPNAVSPELELQRYLEKISAGAEFAITQPVFDPRALYDFMEKAAKGPRTIPIIAGIWPLVSYKNAEFMRNEVPGVEVPDEIMKRMAQTTTKEEGVTEGLKIAREIAETIIGQVQGIQVSAPFGRVDLALEVLGLA